MARRMSRSARPSRLSNEVLGKARAKASFSRPASRRIGSTRTPLLVSQRASRQGQGVHPGRCGTRYDANRPSTIKSSRRRCQSRGGEDYKAERLPFDTIEFADDSRSIHFQLETSWKCELASLE